MISALRNKSPLSHLLVFLQGLCLVLACYPVGLVNAGPAWFLLLCLAGTVLGLVTLWHNRPRNFSVYPEVRDGAELITSGPYAHVRHPMYGALVLMMVGIAGYNGHWLNYVAAAGVTVVVVIKARLEERLLPQAFPAYASYQGQTSRFIPGIW